MQNVWKIAMVFTGTVIGAGFASGQEIMQFFIRYGRASVFGVLISSAVFTLLAGIVLCKIAVTGASVPSEYIGRTGIIGKIYNMLTTMFMLASFCVMVTATGEMFEQYLGLSKWLGILLMHALCCYYFFRGSNGLVSVNTLLTPFIIAVTVLIFASKLYCGAKPTFAGESIFNNIGMSSFVYVSYNSLSLISVMTAISGLVRRRVTAVAAALTGGFMLLVCALCIWYVLYTGDAANTKIPMLSVTDGIWRTLYMPVLFFAMLTTAVASGTGVINGVGTRKYTVIATMLVLSVLSIRAGFTELVAKVYAIFGYFGLIIAAFTIVDGLKYLKIKEKW